ncbi:MAG: S8 family serine peptidase [Rubrivivax sp.]
MQSLELVRLSRLMQQTSGSESVVVGLIDGPVLTGHPDLEGTGIDTLSGAASCLRPNSVACLHGTFVAGILHARRGSTAPALCPGCRLLVRPIFVEDDRAGFPSCEPEDLALAMVDCIRAGARLLNLSVGLLQARPSAVRVLEAALNLAARQSVLVLAAAGNQGMVGASALARHPAVLPVAASTANGTIASLSNLGHSVGRRGLAAPGDSIESLAPDGGTRRFGGTSAATPFVTGTAALLWSLYPEASVARIRHSLVHAARAARTSIAPPLLDAQAAWDALKASRMGVLA